LYNKEEKRYGLLLFLNGNFQRVLQMITCSLHRSRQMVISLSVKGPFGLFYCTATWNRIEPMRLADTPRTKETSTGSIVGFQVALRVTFLMPKARQRHIY